MYCVYKWYGHDQYKENQFHMALNYYAEEEWTCILLNNFSQIFSPLYII